ncbi:MAG: hypothetical protein ACRDGB_10470 [Candidatus Limnocylindria bacterium]
MSHRLLSAAVLVAVNLVPLIGVAFWGWSLMMRSGSRESRSHDPPGAVAAMYRGDAAAPLSVR